MANQVALGNLICSLYDRYAARYGDNELAALAADVALNDLLIRFDVPGSLLDGELPSDRDSD